MHTRCFHNSQHCREPWSWLLSWEQSALHTWLHTSYGVSVDWWYLWGKSCCFTRVIGRFSSPSSLCYLNLSTFEGFDEIEINKAPLGRFCLGWVERLTTSHWMKRHIKPKSRYPGRNTGPTFLKQLLYFVQNKNDKIISKESSLLLFI